MRVSVPEASFRSAATSSGDTKANAARPSRDGGIDAFRYAMALLVIGLHILPPVAVGPDRPLGLPGWAVAVDVLSRCAVPFFFITSGYYFRPDRGVWSNLQRTVVRIAPIYIVWYVNPPHKT
ncbi:MAG: hypothetical protein EOO77_43990 [Oxalobacteraceae bacterium]|nr:MAG: hypothetical protein EOO77_43990 [Oxalobacteraceae bacterium]